MPEHARDLEQRVIGDAGRAKAADGLRRLQVPLGEDRFVVVRQRQTERPRQTRKKDFVEVRAFCHLAEREARTRWHQLALEGNERETALLARLAQLVDWDAARLELLEQSPACVARVAFEAIEQLLCVEIGRHRLGETD